MRRPLRIQRRPCCAPNVATGAAAQNAGMSQRGNGSPYPSFQSVGAACYSGPCAAVTVQCMTEIAASLTAGSAPCLGAYQRKAYHLHKTALVPEAPRLHSGSPRPAASGSGKRELLCLGFTGAVGSTSKVNSNVFFSFSGVCNPWVCPAGPCPRRRQQHCSARREARIQYLYSTREPAGHCIVAEELFAPG